jgi:hypothetical protein
MENKHDELMSIESDDKNIFIRIPIDLLVFAQENRDNPFKILDTNKMVEYFKRYFLDFVERSSGDGGSDFEILLDAFFEHSYEMAEDWLEEDNSWMENQ